MQKKLYRSKKEKMLGGVAGGLGQYFDVDPVLVRVLFVITTFMSGTGAIAYLILWIITPVEPSLAYEMNGTEEHKNNIEDTASDVHFEDVKTKEKTNKRIFGGVTLILIGMVFLANNIFPNFDFMDILPLILIGLGASILLSNEKRGYNENK